MKRAYETPMAWAEEFAPNEYVSACVEGMIQCAIPGDSAYKVNDGTSARTFDRFVYNGLKNNWPGPGIDFDRKDHGICGEAASITFSDSDGSGSGFEMNNGVLDTSRPIYNISGYNLSAGKHYVTWKSNNGSQEYSHYGILDISYIDDKHPNHS